MDGKCGVILYSGVPTVVRVTPSILTLYRSKAIVYSYSGDGISGQMIAMNNEVVPRVEDYNTEKNKYETGVVIYNDNTHTGIYGLIEHYATLLAHLDLTINIVSVNMREGGNIYCVSTNKFKRVIEEYRGKLFGGKFAPIADLGLSTVKTVPNNYRISGYLGDLYECRKNIFNEFYNIIGVKTSFEKKGNMIKEEVNSNSQMLELNIESMLEQRRIGYDALKKYLGLDIGNFGFRWAERGVENVLDE